MVLSERSVSGQEGAAVILDAALAAFAEHGYHGTSMRDIESRMHLSVAAIYHHYSSKHELLDTLMTRVVREIDVALREAQEQAAPDPVHQLWAVTSRYVRFHGEHRAECFVSNTELRSLTDEARGRHMEHRRAVQTIVNDIVDAGVRSGDFLTPYPTDAGRAIVTMSRAVASWYRPSGPLTLDVICERYARLALVNAECRHDLEQLGLVSRI